MVFFHGFFTFGFLFEFNFAVKLFNFFYPAEPFFALIFIVISGICSHLSRNNLKRGLKLLMVALALNAVTILFLEGCEIYFGILNCLSISMIVFGLLQKQMDKIPFWTGFILSSFLFLLTYGVSYGCIGIPNVLYFPLSDFLYQNNFFAFLGFYGEDFFSADYFPLLPWIFAFFTGTFLGRPAKSNRFPKFMYKKRIPFFSFTGRHSLLIYLAHQPIIFGLAYIFKLF